MPERKTIEVDLTDSVPSRVQSAAFYAMKHLAAGETVVLITAQDPALMMQSIDLQLRNTLAWNVVVDGVQWRTTVRYRGDIEPQDVLDLLTRDHHRLDGLLGRGLRLVNQGDRAVAAPVLLEFALALRRHIAFEDDELTPRLAAVVQADAVAVMRREHAEILGQLAVVEECLGGSAPDTGELGIFAGMLSGTLAKHEYREEHNLFPQWRAALAAAPQAVREELLARATLALPS